MKKKLIPVFLVIAIAALVGFVSKQDNAKIPVSPKYANTHGKVNLDSLIKLVMHNALKGGNGTAQITPPQLANQPILISSKPDASIGDIIVVEVSLIPNTQQVALSGPIFNSAVSGPINDTILITDSSNPPFRAPLNGTIESVLPTDASSPYSGVTSTRLADGISLITNYYDAYGDTARVWVLDMLP